MRTPAAGANQQANSLVGIAWTVIEPCTSERPAAAGASRVSSSPTPSA